MRSKDLTPPKGFRPVPVEIHSVYPLVTVPAGGADTTVPGAVATGSARGGGSPPGRYRSRYCVGVENVNGLLAPVEILGFLLASPPQV